MNKKWYQSKAKWGSIALTAGTVLTAVGQYLTGVLDTTGLITGLGAALGIWGVRDALK